MLAVWFSPCKNSWWKQSLDVPMTTPSNYFCMTKITQAILNKITVFGIFRTQFCFEILLLCIWWFTISCKKVTEFSLLLGIVQNLSFSKLSHQKYGVLVRVLVYMKKLIVLLKFQFCHIISILNKIWMQLYMYDKIGKTA